MQGTYGGSPMDWLNLPEPVLEMFALNREMVESERQLFRINATSLGSGFGDQKVFEKAIRELERSAGVVRKARKPKSLDALRAAGFNVKEV